jgi:O-antigen/teichoic acid export membrane protein
LLKRCDRTLSRRKQENGVALSGTEAERPSTRAIFARVAVRVAAWRKDGSDRSIAQRIAGAAFLIRIVSAAILYITQVLLARWMGRFEFGIYVYVWSWVGFIGMLSPLGVAYSAQRFVPEYRTRGEHDQLRGFLVGSRWLCFGLGTFAGAAMALTVFLLGDRVPAHYWVPFLLASLTLPIFAVSAVQDSISRSFNWIDLALIPGFVVHPLIILATMAGLHVVGAPLTAAAALLTACAAMWMVTLAQLILLERRLGRQVEPGARRYDLAVWIWTALPIFLVDSFFLMLTYVDILVLQMFVGPADIAVYFAATKTLALINFVYFAVGAAAGHRFSEYHANGEHDRLAKFIRDTIRWTFWPSLALAFVLLALGKPILSLFGPGFSEGYALMCIMMIGLVARASVGPSERLLNMTGQQRLCALVYATAFATNLVLCLVLIPRFGLYGAAFATATAVVVESSLLFTLVKRKLGLHVFVWGG